MKDFIEIQFWKIAIKILKWGYGEFCYNGKLDTRGTKCIACDAEDTIKFIRNHIENIELF